MRVQRRLDREEVADDEGMRTVAEALERLVADRNAGTRPDAPTAAVAAV